MQLLSHIDAQDPAILHLTFNRPEQRNAVTEALADAFKAEVDRFEADPALKVAILTGNGKIFCAGMDLGAFAAGERPGLNGPFGFAHFVNRPREKPMIAAINGGAFAGGFEIALACDMIVAAEDALFALPEVKRGIIAAGGGAIRLPARLPLAIANELLLTGDTVPAQRLYDLGLINALTPAGQAVEGARAMAARISPNAPLALRESRRLAHDVASQGEAEAWAANARAWAAVAGSQDAIEGALSFKQKRPPVWVGA